MQIKSRKQILYEEVIKPSLIEEFKHQNKNEVASLKAIYLSICFGKKDKKHFEEWLEIISGQRPAITKAKQSISQFGIREGSDIGYRVSLRRNMMYNFLDRLFIALLNDKSLKAVPMKSFTQHKKGKTAITMSMGIKDITIFHGVMVRSTERQGMNVTFVISSKSKIEAAKLLESLDLPIAHGEKR